MSKAMSGRQRWIIAQMKKGAWLAEDRDAFMEESTYILFIHDEKTDQAVMLGYVHDTTVEKLEAAGLIAMVDQGREIRRHGKFVTTEWDYYLTGHPATLPSDETIEDVDDEFEQARRNP